MVSFFSSDQCHGVFPLLFWETKTKNPLFFSEHSSSNNLLLDFFKIIHLSNLHTKASIWLNYKQLFTLHEVQIIVCPPPHYWTGKKGFYYLKMDHTCKTKLKLCIYCDSCKQNLKKFVLLNWKLRTLNQNLRWRTNFFFVLVASKPSFCTFLIILKKQLFIIINIFRHLFSSCRIFEGLLFENVAFCAVFFIQLRLQLLFI